MCGILVLIAQKELKRTNNGHAGSLSCIHKYIISNYNPKSTQVHMADPHPLTTELLTSQLF